MRVKSNFIALDLHFEVVAQLGHQFLDPGSPGQFLVVSSYWETTN